MSRPTPLIPPPCSDIQVGADRHLRLGAQLGRGGVATVYRGSLDGALGVRRPVAVKVFDAITPEDLDVVLGALSRAARRWACVRHPNVVGLEDLALLGGGRPYAVLELVEGRTLARLLSRTARRRERLPLDVALFIALEAVEGLAGARLACSPDGLRLVVVHGELGPADVLLSWQGEVKVGDFGLAAASRAPSGGPTRGAVVRRMTASAPEVARGHPADGRSDVFSLGVLLHELLVGPRFPAMTTEPEAVAWARDGVVHDGLFAPQPPQLVRAVLLRALERDPARRYPHAGAMAYDLRRASLSLGVGDGRPFLRSALARAFGDEGAEDDEEATTELGHPRRPSLADRFARLRGEDDLSEDVEIEPDAPPPARQSGMLPVASRAAEDDDDERAPPGRARRA